ncbi:unnamed protein product [Trichogramma brassicae]|uniref:Uncharacterized protein n=1 Tax=Trichogramma brassicae TaxID=86971 RepID=A0A6H5J6Q9_9HYME|nr:unnamed protein product [Trichogramma brassicae]
MKYSRASLCLHMTREGLRDIPASDHFNYNLYSREERIIELGRPRSRECENGQSCMRAQVKLMEVKLKARKGRSAEKKKQQRQQRIIASRKTHTHTRCTHTRARVREANGSFEEA